MSWQSRMMRWSVPCMTPMRNLYMTLICEGKVMRCLRRSECRGEGIIKMDIIVYGVQLWTGLSGTEYWSVVCSCEYGNEHYGSHKLRGILHWQHNCEPLVRSLLRPFIQYMYVLIQLVIQAIFQLLTTLTKLHNLNHQAATVTNQSACAMCHVPCATCHVS